MKRRKKKDEETKRMFFQNMGKEEGEKGHNGATVLGEASEDLRNKWCQIEAQTTRTSKGEETPRRKGKRGKHDKAEDVGDYEPFTFVSIYRKKKTTDMSRMTQTYSMRRCWALMKQSTMDENNITKILGRNEDSNFWPELQEQIII